MPVVRSPDDEVDSLLVRLLCPWVRYRFDVHIASAIHLHRVAEAQLPGNPMEGASHGKLHAKGD